MRKYQICKNCVMDTSDSYITFDENGICDHCNTYYSKIEPNWNYGLDKEDELLSLISKIKRSKNNDFDCIMGMSGGIDSSYLLTIMKEKYNLNPLVFHVDAGWNSQIAVNNIENIIDKLNLDLFTEVINWEEMKDLQLSFFKSGVPHIDTPQDHAFFASMYKFASKYKIKYILTGGNYSTECIRNPKEWMYYQSDIRQLKDIHSKFGKLNLRDFPTTNILYHKIWLPYFRNIKLFRPLDMLEYNKDEAIKYLEKNFSFKKYPQKHFESRFTKFYESYWLYERFSYDVRRVQFSSLILTNQMTRDQALLELKKKPYDIKNLNNDLNYISNKLEISVSELKSYFKMEKKSYKDYKSQENFYKLGTFFMNILGLNFGGKR